MDDIAREEFLDLVGFLIVVGLISLLLLIIRYAVSTHLLVGNPI